jgi:hypothetical protein
MSTKKPIQLELFGEEEKEEERMARKAALAERLMAWRSVRFDKFPPTNPSTTTVE